MGLLFFGGAGPSYAAGESHPWAALKKLKPLVRENRIARLYGLEYLWSSNPQRVKEFIKKYLISVPAATTAFYIEEKEVLPELKYARPYALQFLEDISEDHFKRYSKPLRITGLFRTPERQGWLVFLQRSVAGCNTEDNCSSHLTGAAADISKKFMGGWQEKWLRDRLRFYMRMGMMHFIEERHHFHTLVLPTYNYLSEIGSKKGRAVHKGEPRSPRFAGEAGQRRAAKSIQKPPIKKPRVP